MASKKNFAQSLAKGIRRDGELRASVVDRFSNAEKVISSRPNGLLDDGKGTPASPSIDNDIERLVDTQGVKRRFVRLPLAAIVANPLNSRTFYSPDAVSARASSIQKEGQLVPVLVTPNPDRQGQFFLIDGHYRRLAMQSLGRQEIDACVLDSLSTVDFYRLSRALNHERESETVLDVALGLKRLRDNGIAKTDEELVSIAGESASKISKLLALLDLPAPVRDLVQENSTLFGINIAYELVLYFRASDASATEALARRIIDEGLAFRRVEAIRKALETGSRAKKQLSRQYRILAENGGELGTLKEWDSGRVMLDIRFDDTAQRDALVEEIKARFNLARQSSQR